MPSKLQPNTSSTTVPASQTTSHVASRLAEITRQLAEKQGISKSAPLAAFTCPIDPAERAACDSCQ